MNSLFRLPSAFAAGAFFMVALSSAAGPLSTIPFQEKNRWVYQYDKTVRHRDGGRDFDTISEGKAFVTVLRTKQQGAVLRAEVACERSGLVDTWPHGATGRRQSDSRHTTYARTYEAGADTLVFAGTRPPVDCFDTLISIVPLLRPLRKQALFGKVRPLSVRVLQGGDSVTGVWIDSLAWIDGVGAYSLTKVFHRPRAPFSGDSLYVRETFRLLYFNDRPEK